MHRARCNFLLTANWLLGITYLGSLVAMYLARVNAEEEMMLVQFGDEYRQYIKTTGRLLPWLSRTKASPHVS